MIIYVVNKAFPVWHGASSTSSSSSCICICMIKTFVTSAKPKEKVARVRAQLLHTLHELGKDEHSFHLRYKGQILRDAFCLTDYEIKDNAIVTMVPVGKSRDHLMEIQSVASSEFYVEQNQGQPADVMAALNREIKTFDSRERMVADFKVLLYVHFLFGFLAMLTVHWYSTIWLLLFWAIGTWFVPTYSRIGGFVGNTSHLKQFFCASALFITVACFVASLYFCITGWIFVTGGDCSDWVDEGNCSHAKIYSAVFFSIHCLLLGLTFVLTLFLLRNFKIDVGDYIEKFLVQERDVDTIMRMARHGKLKEKRLAAYDLAAMVASSDDNKFRIVAEGGMEVLMSLAMSRDELTQEHAVEALAEILTIPSIQDTFVEMGGVRTLTTILHSPRPRAMQEAAVALYNIVSDSEENKHALLEDQGLEDLSHAAYEGTIYCQRIIASIFLELVFNAEIRGQLANRNTPAQTMVQLCRSNDPDTQRFALQSLEVLAIESPDLICVQDDLLEILLGFPFRSMDQKLYVLAGKILLYFAENPRTCEQLLNLPRARDSLELFVKTTDPILQKVTVKIIFCCCDVPILKEKAVLLGMTDVVEYVRDYACDIDAREMADQCLKELNSLSELNELSSMTTLEKLKKMEMKPGARNGSQISLRSDSRSSSDSSSFPSTSGSGGKKKKK